MNYSHLKVQENFKISCISREYKCEKDLAHDGLAENSQHLGRQKGGIVSYFRSLEKWIRDTLGGGVSYSTSLDNEIKITKETVANLVLKTMQLKDLVVDDPDESKQSTTYFDEVKQIYGL